MDDRRRGASFTRGSPRRPSSPTRRAERSWPRGAPDLGPRLERLGWGATRRRDDQAGELRTIASRRSGTYGRDEDVITEALRRFDATELVGDLADRSSPHRAPNRPGDAAEFERRRQAATPPGRAALLFAMAQVPDEASAPQVFDRCLTDIRSQDAPYLVTALLGQRDQGPAVWRRLRDRWDEVLAYFPEGMQAFATLGVRGIIGDEGLAREIRAFHESHPGRRPTASPPGTRPHGPGRRLRSAQPTGSGRGLDGVARA